MNNYLVAGRHSWNRKHYSELSANLGNHWKFVANPDELDEAVSQSVKWEYIFFLHWSWKVPKDIYEKYECVCFHMTDVPYGRGGSPLQNLIARGHTQTKLSALKMVEELDAGPVYLKASLSLENSTAEEIYIKASRLSLELAQQIATQNIKPVEQEGEVVLFKRRNANESELPKQLQSIEELHNFIRMLDADGYPKAFIKHNNFKIELCRSSLYDGKVKVEANIKIDDANEEQ